VDSLTIRGREKKGEKEKGKMRTSLYLSNPRGKEVKGNGYHIVVRWSGERRRKNYSRRLKRKEGENDPTRRNMWKEEEKGGDATTFVRKQDF